MNKVKPTKIGVGDYCCPRCGFQSPSRETVRTHIENCEQVGYLIDEALSQEVKQ